MKVAAAAAVGATAAVVAAAVEAAEGGGGRRRAAANLAAFDLQVVLRVRLIRARVAARVELDDPAAVGCDLGERTDPLGLVPQARPDGRPYPLP